MKTLDTCVGSLAAVQLDELAFLAAQQMKDKWNAVMLAGNFPGLILMRTEELTSLRKWARLERDSPATFRCTPILGVDPGEVHQFGHIVIGRTDDIGAIQEQLSSSGLPFQIGELREGSCWLVARQGAAVGQTG